MKKQATDQDTTFATHLHSEFYRNSCKSIRKKNPIEKYTKTRAVNLQQTRSKWQKKKEERERGMEGRRKKKKSSIPLGLDVSAGFRLESNIHTQSFNSEEI